MGLPGVGEDHVGSLSCRQVSAATEDGPEAEMGRGWNPGIRSRPLPWGPQGPPDSMHFLDVGLRERVVSRMISVTGMGQVGLVGGGIQEVTGYLARSSVSPRPAWVSWVTPLGSPSSGFSPPWFSTGPSQRGPRVLVPLQEF